MYVPVRLSHSLSYFVGILSHSLLDRQECFLVKFVSLLTRLIISPLLTRLIINLSNM